MEKTLRSPSRRYGALALAALLAAPALSLAVPLTNGGLITSWENGEPADAEGWYTPTWAKYTFQNGTADWEASTEAATHGSRSLKLTYTTDGTGNFNWGTRFESYTLAADAKTAWEAPWREALADNPANYSVAFDLIYRVKSPTQDGIPLRDTGNPADWGANVSVAMDWGAAAENGGYSGWTQFNSLGFWSGTADQVVTAKIPLNTIIGGTNGVQIPANFHWIQFHIGPNGGWQTQPQEVAFYIDNLRITQDVFPQVPGDADGDGDVDLDDQGIWASNFTGSLGAGTGDATFGQGDFDGDKDVDLDDQGIWASNFTGSLAPSALASVPEPASLAAAVLTLSLFARRRRA